MSSTLTIVLDTRLEQEAPEAKYVLRTLARFAGFGHRFVWAREGTPADIYYGPRTEQSAATVRIRAAAGPLSGVRGTEPAAFHERGGLGFLEFGSEQSGWSRAAHDVRFENDVVRGAFWLLTGAGEARYSRDRRDNFHLDGAFLLRHSLLQRPLVSQFAAFLRDLFRSRGKQPVPLPWTCGSRHAAFAFSHDVDYPQMIRWIESLRLLKDRGLPGLPSVRGVLNGSNHFWRFSDWIELEKRFGARPAFYFSARRGSLFQYATGTPDCFYDIFSPAFRDLFRLLAAEGCEVGLHASYHSHHSAAQIAAERQALKQASGAPVEGNRHHYWRLNPAAPHETLARHEQAGLSYDTSLAFEFYPGFRRGVCHPFHPWHPEERRELKVLQIPPAWMDDHFDRRLAMNRIESPEACARGLLDAARATGGVAVVDYHVRGMNGDFFPRYGPWLERFAEAHFDSTLAFHTPAEIARLYREYEAQLDARSADETAPAEAPPPLDEPFEVGRMRPGEVPAVARMHFDFFGRGQMHGHSIASLGLEFLEEVFYRLNLDNPYLFVDVARYGGQIAGYSVYASDGGRVFRETLRRHPAAMARAMLRVGLRRPLALARHVLGNLSFLADTRPEPVRGIRAWYFLLGVQAEYRTRDFRERTGRWVAGELWASMERTLREQGCGEFWTVVGAHNKPMNELHEKFGMDLVARGTAQGLPGNYYRKSLAPPGAPPAPSPATGVVNTARN